MGFVQIGFLSALAALAIPIIIHLMFLRRARRVDLGTLRFLKIVLSENARRRKLKRWLLLALRCACLGLLATLFARPYLIALDTSSTERLVVILVDRSASMARKSGRERLLDQAINEASQIASRCGEGTQLEVAFFDHRVHAIATARSDDSTADLQRLHSAIRDSFAAQRSLPGTYSSTDYGLAMAWARDVCVKSGRTHKELYVLTDLQRTGFDRTECEPLPDDIELRVVDLGQAFTKNLAVTSIQLSRATVRPGESVVVRALVVNAGPFPVEKAPVVLHIEKAVDGNPTVRDRSRQELRQQITLEADSSAAVEFELPNMKNGVWRGDVTIESSDELSFDNQRYFAFDVSPPTDVLLVDGDPGNSPYTAETFFLEAAIRLAVPGETFHENRFTARTVPFLNTQALSDLSKTKLVVLANVPELSESDARRLATFVEGGGGLLIFSGNRVDMANSRSLEAEGLGVGEIEGPTSASEASWRVEAWERDHAVFRPFNDPEHGDLRRLVFRTITRLKPLDEARVLARCRGGQPLLVERQHGRGKVLWFLSACDRDWSDWPRSRLFVPLVHQMLSYLAGLADGGPVRHWNIDEIDGSQQELTTEPSSGPVPGVVAVDGIWRVINASSQESEMARSTVQEFAEHFGVRVAEQARADEIARETKAASTAALREDEIWHWVILGLIAVSFVETFVGNRTAA